MISNSILPQDAKEEESISFVRENKESREGRESKENREIRESRESKENKESKESKGSKELTLEALLQRSTQDAKAISKRLKDVIQKSTLSDPNPMKQSANVVKAFNERLADSKKKPIIGIANFRPGVRIEPNEFFLAHQNKIPELASANGNRLLVEYTKLRTESGRLGIIKQSECFFGAHGSYVINVPKGKYAKAWNGSDSHPVILDEGVHVIHDPLFRFDINDPLKNSLPHFDAGTAFVDQSRPYLDHGTLHILRVPQGKWAKVIVNGKAELLEPHDEPYVFNTANFVFNYNTDLVDQSLNYISHQNLHILRVPQGKLAKVIVNGKARLLEHQDEPYIFDTPNFVFDYGRDLVDLSSNYVSHQNLHILRVPPGHFAKVWVNGRPELKEPRDEPYIFDTARFVFNPETDFVKQNEWYIGHGTTHILRVPAGCVAKIWDGATPRLLEFREEPYVYHDCPQFQLEKTKDGHLFERSDAKLIVHGAIKRIIPPINEVAITSKEGELCVITKATVINSPTHSFVDFLDTSVQTLEFPSMKTKKQRQEERKQATRDEVNYEIFTTSDSLKVGVKLLVAYKISDPKKALALGFKESIIDHIEGVVTADMGRAIQSCSSQEFLSSYQSKPRSISVEGQSESSAPSAPQLQSYQDMVKAQLADDLAEYGISLIRMNVEESKVLNEAIAGKMEEQALSTAKASAEISVLRQNYQIAENKALQEAQVKKIQKDQENAMSVSAAEADAKAASIRAQGELDAARMKAEAEMISAKTKNEIALMEAKTKSDAAKLLGEQYKLCPDLVTLELAKIKFNALFANAKLNVTSKELNSFFTAPGLTLFSSGLSDQPRMSNIVSEQVKEEKSARSLLPSV